MSLGCKLPWQGPAEADPYPEWTACSGASGEALNAAIDSTVEKGVVFVAASGEYFPEFFGGKPRMIDVSNYAAPQNNPNVLVTSIMTDSDGLPSYGSEPAAGSCSESGSEDTLHPHSFYGANVTMTVPWCWRSPPKPDPGRGRRRNPRQRVRSLLLCRRPRNHGGSPRTGKYRQQG